MPLRDRWFRTTPDSSVLRRPRLLARSMIALADLDEHIGVYERLLNARADLRMPIPDFGGLELAAVGDLLLIASDRPFTPIQLKTTYSLIVPSLAGRLAALQPLGVTVMEPPEMIVPGSRARVRFPDATIAELVEHRPRPRETAAELGSTDGSAVRFLVRRAVPHGTLDAAVRFYESALQTEACAQFAAGGWDSCELAIVGNLLLVGSDELWRDHDIRLAVARPTAAMAEFRAHADRVGAESTVGDADGRTVLTLATGMALECWVMS